MNKVYVVTAGEYSDYGICAVFDNLDDAEKYCACGHGEFVEEYNLNESKVETSKKVVYRYHVRFPERETNWIYDPAFLLESDVEADKAKIKSHMERWGRYKDVVRNDSHPDRYVYLTEHNKSKALKIVRDRIAKYKAEKEGL